MRKYARYVSYLARHKWYVLLECTRQGLFWRGLVHDWSKFLPSEFLPYTEHFFGRFAREWRDSTGYYKPTDTGDPAFDFAWLLHQKRNRHHWQWWVLPDEGGALKVLEIPEPYLTEMICDWVGAGKAQGNTRPNDHSLSETRRWYRKNGPKMVLGPATRREIESRLSIPEGDRGRA